MRVRDDPSGSVRRSRWKTGTPGSSRALSWDNGQSSRMPSTEASGAFISRRGDGSCDRRNDTAGRFRIKGLVCTGESAGQLEPLLAGRMDPTTDGLDSRIWSATSRRWTSISLGNAKASRTRSPLIEAIRTTPKGLAGSQMTTSSPSRRVMTSMQGPPALVEERVHAHTHLCVAYRVNEY